MSKCTTKVGLRGICATLFAVGLQVVVASQSLADEPRMATFENAGETHFALSITPKTVSQSQRSSDIVVYVDTSASQAGAYKRDSIELLKQLVKSLNAEDRIQVIAVDLDPVPMTRGFISPGDGELRTAIQNLRERVSLGSTDMEAMLAHAAKAFPQASTRNKNVIYIGDGISRASVLHSEVFGKLITDLVGNQISVSNFAIGPERNIELLAAISNNTGGNLLIDTDEDLSVEQSAVELAQTTHGSVFWPIDGKMDDSVVTLYPSHFPPLRSDRDTVVLGTLSDRDGVEMSIAGKMDGQDIEMSWSISPEPASDEFAFLPGMIRDAQKDGGLTLPTIGSEGLKEFARVRMVQAGVLSDLGAQALANGDQASAQKLAAAAVSTSSNPANTRADLLSMAAVYRVNESDSFNLGEDALVDPSGAEIQDPATGEPATQDPAAATPAESTPAAAAPVASGQQSAPELPIQVETPGGGITLIGQQDDQNEIQRMLRDKGDQSTGMLLGAEDKIRMINQRVRKQVEFELKRATEEQKVHPDGAIERLKNMIEIIDQTPDLFSTNRAELRHSLESSLLSSRRRKLEFDENRALHDLNVSTAKEIAEQHDRFVRREEHVSRLVNRIDSLLKEGNYRDAVDVAEAAFDIDTESPVAAAVEESTHIARNYNLMTQLRLQKRDAFMASMYQTELVTIPFPGDPLMVFPDADVWAAKRLRRKKYDNVRLTGSASDEKILDALEEPANFDYDEDPWSDIQAELSEKYGINIVLDDTAADDGLPSDELITRKLAGLRLKNALRIMLRKYNATFVVKNEVLNIISLDNAGDPEWHVTNVYNVGDLIAPRSNQGGGFAGGGGQGGGGFGGGGRGGGGRGGGGGGFGGGGQFCIQDTQINVKLTDSVKRAPAQPVGKPQVIDLGVGYNPATAWSNYFSKNFANPADIRLTVRKLMKEDKTAEVVSLIHGAIEHDQLQGWMYEGLVLAMQISGKPKSEVERALMSAVDLSDNEDDALYAAQYMARNNMELRAIRLLKGFARSNPTRTEPYVIGLRAAQKIDDLDGIMWATTGIFGQEWPDHPEIVNQAKYASTAVKTELEKAGRTDELAAFEEKLQQARERDCYIRVTWTGDADLDLFVAEPGGTTCSRLVKRTTAGGILMGDRFTLSSGVSGGTTEEYILPKGFSGDYRLMIKRMWGEVTSGKATVSIHNHFRSPQASSLTKQVNIDDQGALVLFSLDKGRRTDPLEDHAIETVVRRQMATNRAVLAQQLDENYSSGAASDYFSGLLAGNGGQGGAGPLTSRLLPGAVGYRPVITQIPEGAFLTVNHATTADRLYVMMSLNPSFQQIKDVTTFNILGTAETAEGIANSAGGQGGGGGGGGGGFGGGGGGGGGFF